jgi:hypothetical protein
MVMAWMQIYNNDLVSAGWCSVEDRQFGLDPVMGQNIQYPRIEYHANVDRSCVTVVVSMSQS